MQQDGVPGDGHNERRHWPRMKLAVSVRLSKRTDGPISEAVSCETARAVDLSAGGAYVTVRTPESRFLPGEILSMSIGVPAESRRAFPFSRLAGSCRVVRVDEHWIPGSHIQGLALAFCADSVTMLGTLM